MVRGWELPGQREPRFSTRQGFTFFLCRCAFGELRRELADTLPSWADTPAQVARDFRSGHLDRTFVYVLGL